MQNADLIFHDKSHGKAVGMNQTKKQILSGNAKLVYIASDADVALAGQMTRLCEENHVEYNRSFSMSELGQACGIDVSCAVCALTING